MMRDEEDRGLIERIRENPSVLIYSRERTLGSQSPSMVYLPNKAVMFKMMRACLDTYYIEDLWIYTDDE